MNILLIEDNESIISGLKYSLEKELFKVITKTTIKNANSYLEENTPNIIILDVTLPDGNGFDFYQKVIKNKNIKTIFLTAKDDEEDVVKGLSLGADDYMTKPFSTKELILRIKKILRNNSQEIVTIKDITFDMDKMIVYKNNKKLDLTTLELKILHLLFINKNKIVSRDMLIEYIWEITGNDIDDHTITVYLNRIREKLSSNIIVTVKGIGYRIDGE